MSAENKKDDETQKTVKPKKRSETDKEKENLQQLLQEEINHRNNLNSKLKQSEVRIFLSDFFKFIYVILF